MSIRKNWMYPVDGKFGVKVTLTIAGEHGEDSLVTSEIVNAESAEAIPPDEPLFLLRARDFLAVAALASYLEECVKADCPPLHVDRLVETARRFQEWARQNNGRMKQPGSSLRGRPGTGKAGA